MMLPPPPKTLGRLGDVFISALDAVLGKENKLSLPKKQSVIVLMVDGLGIFNLEQAGGHARFLNSQSIEKAGCYFPATTSTSLSSLLTGKKPWETGFVGYLVLDRQTKTAMNLLTGWSDFEQGESFQSLQTIAEVAKQKDVEFHVVSLPSYEFSGLTGATTRGAEFHGISDLEERFAMAKSLVATGSPKLVYLYVPELDQIAHAFGSKSLRWLNELEFVDSIVRKFSESLPKTTGLIVTADHGVIDIVPENHIYLDEFMDESYFDYVGGDTRGLFLYFSEATNKSESISRIKAQYSDVAWTLTPEDMINSGYWQDSSRLRRFAPDAILLARKSVALFHRSFARKKSLGNIGHHGSITPEELSIPIIRINF